MKITNVIFGLKKKSEFIFEKEEEDISGLTVLKHQKA